MLNATGAEKLLVYRNLMGFAPFSRG